MLVIYRVVGLEERCPGLGLSNTWQDQPPAANELFGFVSIPLGQVIANTELLYLFKYLSSYLCTSIAGKIVAIKC